MGCTSFDELKRQMKIILFILFNLFLFFSDTENSKEPEIYNITTSMDAVMAQDVQSFFSDKPQLQKRNQVEFWENDAFLPNMKSK